MGEVNKAEGRCVRGALVARGAPGAVVQYLGPSCCRWLAVTGRGVGVIPEQGEYAEFRVVWAIFCDSHKIFQYLLVKAW